MAWNLQNERLWCPPEFQERITDAGGVNRYGTPNFLIAGANTYTVRAGTKWEGEGFPTFIGYRDILLGMNEPAYMLLQWYPPEVYPTQVMWYLENYDEESGLQLCGEYPHEGRYEIVTTFIYREVVNGRLVVERLPLNDKLLSVVVPTLIACKEVSLERQKLSQLEKKEREGAQLQEDIGTVLQKGRLAFGRMSVSFAKQKGLTSKLDKAVDKLSRSMKDAMSMARMMNKGIYVGDEKGLPNVK